MAHKKQKEFCLYVKSKIPKYFLNKSILDVGSLDINGNNRYLFQKCIYTGLDIIQGPNVDIVCPIHLLPKSKTYNVIISTEMLEHDKYWKDSLQAMYDLLVPGGLLIMTCATTGRPEHGTSKTKPIDSPATNDYYQNISKEMLLEAISNWDIIYKEIKENFDVFDLYFFAIKSL